MFWVLRNYISESLGILFTSQSPHRSGKASWRRVLTLLFSNFTKKNLGSRGYLGIVPMVLWWDHCLGASCQGFCGSVPGSWAPRCCRHNFIVAVLEYLSLVRRHRKSLLCSCWWDNPDNPVLRWVREYCHDLYNGRFSKVEVDDFRRFLGYVLKDGYSWM